MSLSHLPLFNACMNGLSACLLVAGYLAIRNKNLTYHRILMLSAVTTSAIFLTSYLYYHFHHGRTLFTGTGALRYVYFTLLISHSILAVVILPLVLLTLVYAARGVMDRHRKLARVTLPLWLYVSVTGVCVYLMLYRL